MRESSVRSVRINKLQISTFNIHGTSVYRRTVQGRKGRVGRSQVEISRNVKGLKSVPARAKNVPTCPCALEGELKHISSPLVPSLGLIQG